MVANAPSDQYLCAFILRPPVFYYIINIFKKDANGNLFRFIRKYFVYRKNEKRNYKKIEKIGLISNR